MATIQRTGLDIAHSVGKFLLTTAYTVGAVTGTLVQHHTSLAIVHGYPDDLLSIKTPTLAIQPMVNVDDGGKLYGGGGDDEGTRYGLSLFGFVVGRTNDALSKLYRDRLMNDVRELLVRVGEDDGIVLFDHGTKDEIGLVEVERVSASVLPSNMPDIEADRYRFQVDLDIVWT